MTSVVEELENVAELCGRIRFSFHEDLAENTLAPVASFLGAETASFRSLSLVGGMPMPDGVVSLGIPPSVDDAYLTRYFRLDPARRLLRRRFSKPLFAHATRPGEWSIEQGSAAERHRFKEEFFRYRNEFLLPNNFFHHVGFCFQDLEGRTLLFDFHRPARARAFGKLEVARVQVLATFLQAKAARYPHAGTLHCTAGGTNGLSARELEVAHAVAHGLSNKEVAARLNISVRTVENHLRSVFAKLRVSTRTRLAAKLHETVRGDRHSRCRENVAKLSHRDRRGSRRGER